MNTIVVVACIILVIGLTVLMLIGVIHAGFAEFCIALLLLLVAVCAFFIAKIKKMK